eukprot:496515-Pelagomonas_calceolata.AAC.2
MGFLTGRTAHFKTHHHHSVTSDSQHMLNCDAQQAQTTLRLFTYPARHLHCLPAQIHKKPEWDGFSNI